MKTVLILGANGRLGTAAAKAFAKAGWRVVGQARRETISSWPEGAMLTSIPLSDTEGLTRAASGASVVIYALNPPYAQWKAEALPLLRQGLAVARALNATFMLPGNVYGYGRKLPRVLREDTPERGDHPKAAIRIAMEAEMARAAQEARSRGEGLRCVVLRAGDFFGSGGGSWLDLAIAKDIARGQIVYPGPLDRTHAWAYLPDLAAVFEQVASAPSEAPFETLHFPGYTVTGREFTDALSTAASELGVRPPQGFRIGGMPWGLIRTVGLVYPAWGELATMSYLWTRPHGLDGGALEARIGPRPLTPLVAALRQSLTDLGLAPSRGSPAP